MCSDTMSQEIECGAAELALHDIDDKAMFLEALEQLSKMTLVLLGILASHQDVIYINKNKIQTLTDSVHETLKRLTCILESERHSEELVEPERCDNGSFGHILSSNRDLVIATHKVDL